MFNFLLNLLYMYVGVLVGLNSGICIAHSKLLRNGILYSHTLMMRGHQI
jgi:hypothetical protein